MSLVHTAAPGAVESAARALAQQLAGALRPGLPAPSLREFADGPAGPARALGAVRGMGADVLAPFLLAGHPLTSEDTAVLRAAVSAYPAPEDGADDRGLWAARDEGLVRALGRLGVDAADWEGLAEGPDGTQPGGGWADWAATMVRHSPLALPPLDGPVRAAARERRTDLTHGMVRAMLRRDHLGAARLGRWLALDDAAAPEPLLPSALRHLAVLAEDQPRVVFETAVAAEFLGGGR
ncbi:hypothetical protein [Streptomyces sp. NPDC047097]|uniref:hypothetical protein n=1 Tax=Streptomyces sp. NPDC047097 TaxID=3155260 RepID=UPI0033D59183